MAITELLRCISHSLRSPLQTLHAGLSQLTATTATADDGTLDDMRLAADAASRVLDDIVNYHELLLRLGLKTRPPSPAKSKVNLSHIISSSISRHTHHVTYQHIYALSRPTGDTATSGYCVVLGTIAHLYI